VVAGAQDNACFITNPQKSSLTSGQGLPGKGINSGDGGYVNINPINGLVQHTSQYLGMAAATDDGQTGRAWMDHEWSNQLLHPEAVGWDWIGINLFDGSALTAFVLRRRDGSTRNRHSGGRTWLRLGPRRARCGKFRQVPAAARMGFS
jgi:hypothetical protein